MSVISAQCSVASIEVGEPIAGSAPTADAWLAIEQPGPFGREALTDSHFPGDVAVELAAMTAELNIKIVLIRAPGHHPDNHDEQPRRIWFASALPGLASMRAITISTASDLLEFNYLALSEGRLDEVVSGAIRDEEPLLLFCTHARRDVCCARYGRPLALELAEQPELAGRVWESSHLGGHRMAPTAVQLPHGWVHGRLDAETGWSVMRLASIGAVHLPTARGRSSLSAAEQVADITVRITAGLDGLDATSVAPGAATGEWIVTERATGATQSITLIEATGPARPESCSKEPADWHAFIPV